MIEHEPDGIELKGYYNTFVVRIRSDSEGRYSGRIQHINSQESVYFKRFQDIEKFIAEHLEPPSDVISDTGSKNSLNLP
jgi:hypothetical protein